MAEGTMGMPGQTSVNSTNIFDNMKQGRAETLGKMGFNQKNPQFNPQDIFALIQQAYSGPSMSSVLPQVQAQYDAQSKAAEPQYEALKQGGEQMAGQAQSDAGARGLRGSDIEAAGMAGARMSAQQNIAQLRSQLSMAQAQSMAEKIFESYGYDVKQNQQLFQSLAEALGQKIARDEEARLAMENAKALAKANKQAQKSGTQNAVVGAVGTIGAGIAIGL